MTETDASTNGRGLAAVVHQLAALLHHGGGVLTAGDVAGLRRMDPHRIDAPAFYKLVGSTLHDDLPAGREARLDRENRWAAVVVGLAHLGDLHRPGVRLGTALVAAGFAESRFVRLLKADTERLMDELPALGRFLAAKNIPADFSTAARLILSADRRDEEMVRRRLAAEYYGALNQQDHAN